MPRTKTTRKKVTSSKSNDIEKLDILLKKLDTYYNTINVKLEEEYNSILRKFKEHSKQQMFAIPVSILDKTLAELKCGTSSQLLSNESSATSLLNSTKSVLKENRVLLKRSASCIDDEGYLTAESSNGGSGTSRRSRSRQPTKKAIPSSSTRVSRSLSRSQMKRAHVNQYKTPNSGQQPPTSYGTVTPKVKPNTPQVLLRRPKQGEVALSLQGSPLFTGSVVSETIANVNIPLQDGRLLSIQPQKGLRISQIPSLDAETKRQLETLRDNLNKVCALTTRR